MPANSRFFSCCVGILLSAVLALQLRSLWLEQSRAVPSPGDSQSEPRLFEAATESFRPLSSDSVAGSGDDSGGIVPANHLIAGPVAISSASATGWQAATGAPIAYLKGHREDNAKALRWPVRKNGDSIEVPFDSIDLEFAVAPANPVALKINGNIYEFNSSTSSWTTPLMGQQPRGYAVQGGLVPGVPLATVENRIEVMEVKAAALTSLVSLCVFHRESSDDQVLGHPTIESIFNSPEFRDAENRDNWKVGPSKEKVPVYGRYLALYGDLAGTPSRRMQFLVFGRLKNDTGAKLVFRGLAEVSSFKFEKNDRWSCEIRLPDSVVVKGMTGVIWPVGVAPDDHRAFAENEHRIDFDIIEHEVTIAPPNAVRVMNVGTVNAMQLRRPGEFVTSNLDLKIEVDVPGDLLEYAKDLVVVLWRKRGGVVERIERPKRITTVQTPVSFHDTLPVEGDYVYSAEFHFGELKTESSPPTTVLFRTSGPKPLDDITPSDGRLPVGPIKVTIPFDKSRKLNKDSALSALNFALTGPNEVQGRFESASLDKDTNAVTVTFTEVSALGDFTLVVKGLVDEFGVTQKEPKTYKLKRTVDAADPAIRPAGVTATTGPYVRYPEFTPPRPANTGFNPSDKVETRVARLYYFRDAHRVAQIINRKVRSYNRASVESSRQQADKARGVAEDASAKRQKAERDAVAKAQLTRQKERQLATVEQSRERTLELIRDAQTPSATPLSAEEQQRRAESVKSLETLARNYETQARNLSDEVQRLREAENEANETVQQLEATERRAHADQFRLEVAAAHTDPDTYAPGKPNSIDPVEQVSVSVIGEGLIQLRGPLKGINTIRTMIDQIDSPVGQVRVAVHTVQINGEKADRMEVVADQVQRYLDQGRFLSMQSGELLRRSIVQVAARKADEARQFYPGEAQEDRDQRYLHAFFGKDFIDELRAIDSEFLKTGNKLLSLHSMDTTSLASALSLLALARNDTREEILAQFEQLCAYELPRAEESFLSKNMPCDKKWLKCRQPRIHLVGQNATFESLRGFFNAELAHGDTMTPLQREFLRLAQIFKSRLITELEYKQRVMERSMIEDRFGDIADERQQVLKREREAKLTLEQSRQSRLDQAVNVQAAFAETLAELRSFKDALDDVNSQLDWVGQLVRAKESAGDPRKPVTPTIDGVRVACNWDGTKWSFRFADGRNAGADANEFVVKAFNRAIEYVNRILNDDLNTIRYRHSLADFLDARSQAAAIKKQISKDREGADARIGQPRNPPRGVDVRSNDWLVAATELDERLQSIVDDLGRGVDELEQRAERVMTLLGDPNASGPEVYDNWVKLRAFIEQSLLPSGNSSKSPNGEEHQKEGGPLRERINQERRARLTKADDAFRSFLNASFEMERAKQQAEFARRPLDHKKFLDMLVDETEEKYIELLEGTRAHTANVDAYLKRLTTALDDDLNVQFYQPAFRHVRQASQMYDVQFGKTETTSLLMNNRDLGKVSPSATMEFDLPKRDILIAEALNGAKALMNDVGALADDPSFLSMAKMKSGGSTAQMAAGASGGLGRVRTVLPGLNTDTAEQIVAQNANGGAKFGSNLENLIPDPAIYKFETGTGFEIRPVIQPDGQAVVFDFHYMYTTDMREPVRADEKHLGRVKRHFIDTDVQLSNFELREVSRYVVALKAARTSRGVPLFEDIPIAGALFRPLPSDEKSLQENIILAQATIFPTLFDLMGLRWAPAVADLDALRLQNDEFVVRGRSRMLRNRVFDYASEQVDDFLRMPPGERRTDLYRNQEVVPRTHPNGYEGPGLNQTDSQLREGYQPSKLRPETRYAPGEHREGAQDSPRGYGAPGGGTKLNPPAYSDPRRITPESLPKPDAGAGTRRRDVRVVSSSLGDE